MLCKDRIILIFCLMDDVLQGINYIEDVRRQVSDSEIIITAIVSSTSLYANKYSVAKVMNNLVSGIFKS